MKRGTTIVVNENKSYHNQNIKIAIIIALFTCLLILIDFTLTTFVINNKFSEDVNAFNLLNTKTVFSIDKIVLYSSAGATSNEDKKLEWNLNISQYTDIALYLNNRRDENLNKENYIKRMYIDKITFTPVAKGTPELYYKSINNFANYNIIDSNKINEKLDYTVVNDKEIDLSKPEVYADGSTPITLEYLNKNILENKVFPDPKIELKYDGELLRRAELDLSEIKCTISFNINIINYYDQKFVANVYIDVPFINNEQNIYDGSVEKTLENTNLIKFFRIE